MYLRLWMLSYITMSSAVLLCDNFVRVEVSRRTEFGRTSCPSTPDTPEAAVCALYGATALSGVRWANEYFLSGLSAFFFVIGS